MSDRFLERLNWILVALAVIAIQLSQYRGGLGPWWDWAEIFAVLAISIGADRCMPRTASTSGNPPAGVVATLLAALGLHLLIEAGFSVWAPSLGQTMELQTSLALRNLMISTAVFSRYPALLRLSSGLSLTLTCFAFVFEIAASLTLVVAIYAVVGLWWLIGNYWDRIQGKFPEGTERSVPKNAGLLATVVALLLGVCVFLLVDKEQAVTALSGFMPSSGGNQIDSAAANSGVGDGNDLVAGTEDAMSFGPTESEVFLESQMPSLYDVFNDTYDVPVKKKKSNERQRAVALAPDRLQHRHQKVARSEQSSREFSLVRKRSGDRKKGLKDRTSHAMLYVKGRVPMHLRTNIYDRIEGDELVEAVADRSPSLLMTKEEGKPWLELPCFVSDSDIGYVEESLLKFINLKSPRVPTPPHLAQLHIPDVEQTEMFLWTKDGVLRLASENIPPTTVMRQRAYLIAEARMRDERFQRKFAQTITPIAAEESTPRIRELAESWTVEAEPGWETICAITDRLRQDYEHDPSAAQADETADPFETFLFKEKKGADYMFAASAALMLRELGYQVRIVSGFYASPEKYDSNSEQTPIYVDDAHFWVEVSDGANWHTVEPTPGYETLAPPKDLKTRLAEFVWLIATALWYRKWTLVAIALIGLTIWLLRSAILDLVAQLANRWAVPRDTRRRVLRTLQVIALRERFSRDRRPPGATIHAWLSRKSIVAQEEALLLQSITLCGWALYGGPSACPIPSTQIETLRHFTLELSRRPSSSR